MISLTDTDCLWTQSAQAGVEGDDAPICCWNICTGITTGKTPRPPRPLGGAVPAATLPLTA